MSEGYIYIYNIYGDYYNVSWRYVYIYILSYVCTYHMYDTYVYILYDIRGTHIPSMNTDCPKI